jgi:transposase InsO family protein
MNPVTDRDYENAYRINAAYTVHQEDPALGYRLIADELKELGLPTSEPRMWKLCNSQGIWSSTAKKKPKTKRPLPPAHDDLVKRAFTAEHPNELWLTDITEHPTNDGKLYLCAVKDVFGNKIVGYSIASHRKASVAVNALESAIRSRKPVGTIVHSDRGTQFQSKKFLQLLEVSGLRGSMGQVGAAGDNAAMESFFSLVQKNVLDRQKCWASREESRLALVEWIQVRYNRKRRQRRLGKLTPVEFEAVYVTVTS